MMQLEGKVGCRGGTSVWGSIAWVIGEANRYENNRWMGIRVATIAVLLTEIFPIPQNRRLQSMGCSDFAGTSEPTEKEASPTLRECHWWRWLYLSTRKHYSALWTSGNGSSRLYNLIRSTERIVSASIQLLNQSNWMECSRAKRCKSASLRRGYLRDLCLQQFLLSKRSIRKISAPCGTEIANALVSHDTELVRNAVAAVEIDSNRPSTVQWRTLAAWGARHTCGRAVQPKAHPQLGSVGPFSDVRDHEQMLLQRQAFSSHPILSSLFPLHARQW